MTSFIDIPYEIGPKTSSGKSRGLSPYFRFIPAGFLICVTFSCLCTTVRWGFSSLFHDGSEFVERPSVPHKRYITHKGRDGLGHQLLGMYSCMLFSNIDRNTQYVPKIYTWAAHRLSNHTSALFKALQRSFPPAPHGVDVAEVGFCMNELMQICVDQEELYM